MYSAFNGVLGTHNMYLNQVTLKSQFNPNNIEKKVVLILVVVDLNASTVVQIMRQAYF